MRIHQIQIRHDESEDRLLLRLSTTDNREFRFWLTRRFVKRLWTMLVQMLEWDQAVRQQADPETRRAVLDIQHEGYAQQANYAKKFEDAPHQLPLGDAPALLAKAKGKKAANGTQMLSLHPRQGQGIDIALDTKLLHIFSRLLRQAVAKTDWDINLALHRGTDASERAPAAAPRKLN
ncbi:MAG: hypothetical protein ACRET3_13980 [Burkholderiales bacterium]